MGFMLSPLPIDPLLGNIVETVQVKDQVILTATPGAGKTTRLPPELLKAVSGKVAILEPRRMATVAAAQRVADEQQWTLGQEVGYQVRFESKITANTRLVFMTDALLLRRLVDDPELKEFELIVIDEFHERNLNQDLILGVLKELQELGRNIKILIMSATLDVERLKNYLPQAQHIDVPGKVFPLTLQHAREPLRPVTDRDFFERVVDAISKMHTETDGDILVFLPGLGEIQRVQEGLDARNLKREVFQLHGSLSLNEQKNILKAHDKPRVILATNIAEASVTVPGVDRVIDTGLAKIMEMNLASGFSRLELTRIALFNARQRAGRAARQKPGLCLRLWTSHEETTMAEEMVPECQRVDLSAPLLLLAHLGVSDFSTFAWYDSPPAALLKISLRTLQNIGALDEKQHLTPTGQRLMSLPLPPRWGALMLLSEKLGHKDIAAATAALLQDRDIFFGRHEAHSHLECDISYRLDVLSDFQKGKSVSGLNHRQAQMVLQTSEQLLSLVKKTSPPSADLPDPLRTLLLLSQSDRLCRRRGHTDKAVMVGGRGVRLAKESQVKDSEFFLALQGVDLPNQPDTSVSLACGLTKTFVLETLKSQIEISEDIHFDEEKGQFYNRRVRRFQGLELDEPALTPVKPEELGERFVEALEKRWDWLVTQHEGLQHWMKRWNFLCALQPELKKELTPDHIKQTLSLAAFGKTRISDVLEQDLVRWLEGTLDKKIVQQLDKEAPEKFTAPTGFHFKIQYNESEDPFVEIRLQEMFGVTATPRLGLGQKPLTFKLLAPNYRPVQVTSDIASFWKNIYFEVRKELRSRYPKHSWPEDPLTAPAVAKGRRR